MSRTLLDEKRNKVHATSYTYNDAGNISVETFSGKNLSELYQKRYSYDAQHRLIRQEEDNGSVTHFGYLGKSHLLRFKLLSDSKGVQLRYFWEYDADQILTREIQDDGSGLYVDDVTQVTYRLIRVTHPRVAEPFIGLPDLIEEKYLDVTTGQEKLLKQVHLRYTLQGQIGEEELYDANGVFRYAIQREYDGQGRIVQETNAIGQKQCSLYDTHNKVEESNFSGDLTSKMSYDYSNRLIAVSEVGSDGSCHTSQMSYDRLYNRIAETDLHGKRTHYLYDACGQLLKTVYPEVQDGEILQEEYLYNAAGEPYAYTDLRGKTTSRSYNARGAPTHIIHQDLSIEKFTYYTDGTLATAVDQAGTVAHYRRDFLGRVTEISRSYLGETLSVERYTYKGVNLIAKEDAEGNFHTYSYDGASRKTKEQFAGIETSYEYDSMGRPFCIQVGDLRAITEYNLLDQVIEERKEDLQGNILSWVNYTYDAAGNRESITQSIHNLESTETTRFDPWHREVQQIDALGHTTFTTYQEEEFLQKTTIDPLGLQTIETYDALQRRVRIEKRKEGTPVSREEFFYEAGGKLARQVSHLYGAGSLLRTTTTCWDYDAMGRLVLLAEGSEDPEERQTRYSYTAKGELREVVKPDGVRLYKEYDPLGRLVRFSSSDNSCNYSYRYNKLHQLLESRDLKTGKGTYFLYDPHGHLLEERLANGLFVQNEYADARGRRTRCTLPDHSDISYTYDPLHLRSVTSQGMTHRYTQYDLSDYLLESELPGSLGSIYYNFDLRGVRTQVVSEKFAHTIEEFDRCGNIIHASFQFPSQSWHCRYAYDALYQLVQEEGLVPHDYMYDSHNNRLEKDANLYQINALNQIVATDAEPFTYDRNGNPLCINETHYVYDALDRLIELYNKQFRLLFTYDASHRRMSRTLYLAQEDDWNLQEELLFLYDKQNEIGAYNQNGTLQELRILGATPEAEIGAAVLLKVNGELYVPLHDLNGNVTALLSPKTGVLQESYAYTAFGEEQLFSPQPHNPWRFSSKRTDPSGLIYYGRRYYAPDLGRWLTPDPKGFSDGPNLYAFVHNAPLTHVDLYGLHALAYAPNYQPRGYANNFSRDFARGTQSLIELSKQGLIGIRHGAGQFCMESPVALSSVAHMLTKPLYQITGRTDAYSTHSLGLARFNQHYLNSGNALMQKFLPADQTSRAYQTMRTGTALSLEIGSLFVGGYGAVKGIIGFSQLARSPMKITAMTRAVRGIETFQGELLNTHLTQVKKYGSQGYRQLQNNKIRYYGELKAPMKEGEMIGRRRVREWDPETSLKRTWHETLDGSNNIRIVRPESNNGIKNHYVFDSDGNFTGVR